MLSNQPIGWVRKFLNSFSRSCRELGDRSDYSMKADAYSLRSLSDKEHNHAQS